MRLTGLAASSRLARLSCIFSGTSGVTLIPDLASYESSIFGGTDRCGEGETTSGM